jgi:hypothetical protein
MGIEGDVRDKSHFHNIRELVKLPDHRTDGFVCQSVKVPASTAVSPCSDGEVFGTGKVSSISKLDSAVAISLSEL